jgi:hypothetical protein
MNDQNWTRTPLSDAELDAVLDAADKELTAEIRRTTDTAMHREEVLKARPGSAEPDVHGQAEESPKRGIRAAVGNFLIALTGADRRLLTFEVDRQRHITMGMLMLLTTGLAFYAGTTVAAMGFSKPFGHEVGYGIFFALFAFFVDRSITGYVAPLRAKFTDDEPPRRSSRWAPVPRILVAVAASFLLSEVIVLQLFTPRINQQLQVNHLEATSLISRQVSGVYHPRIALAQDQINRAEARVNTAQAQVSKDTQTLQCELYGGGPGCNGSSGHAGSGMLAAADQAHLIQDEKNLSALQQQATSITRANQQKIASIQSLQDGEIRSLGAAVNSSNDMLAREQAFQQLASNDEAILILRVILWFLLVGIDLTPVIIKITTSSGVYEERVRSQILIAMRNTHEVQRRRVARLRMETEIDLHNQRLDHDIAQAELERKAKDLEGIIRTQSADRP